VQDDLVIEYEAVNYRTEPIAYRYLNPDYMVNDPALSPLGIARAFRTPWLRQIRKLPSLPPKRASLCACACCTRRD